ncbi:hypothetical protein H5410_035487 [Solanum commersonii]|uniref:Uncharacterized protein n=1 Tax=Solanum commersonii TaxID=4109 RepID=A0A9J5Y311_SOLCO|nr:hypothetical protein H5410_035487 [Solanum commersonii]
MSFLLHLNIADQHSKPTVQQILWQHIYHRLSVSFISSDTSSTMPQQFNLPYCVKKMALVSQWIFKCYSRMILLSLYIGDSMEKPGVQKCFIISEEYSNKLIGAVCWSTQLQSFDRSSYSGNAQLCDPPWP